MAVYEHNKRQSTRGIGESFNTSRSTVNSHLGKLWKVSKLCVWVAHNLSEQNKEDRISNALNLFSHVKSFFNRIIADGERIVTYDNIFYKRLWQNILVSKRQKYFTVQTKHILLYKKGINKLPGKW